MKTFICIILLAIITFSCQKELSPENNVTTLPTLTTAAATSVTIPLQLAEEILPMTAVQP
jgi:PBP1b-binding outer membrane lipoprotein LpoB